MPITLTLAVLLTTAPDLSTVAERSALTRTGRYEEVERLCPAYERAYRGRVRCFGFGKTPEGRTLWALVASQDGLLDPATNRARGRPVFLFQGGVHAGEIDGKDAGFILLRRWLDAGTKGPLARASALFVPVFNVDGHERFGPHHRPNQRGPVEGGWRTTAHNLNLNRDYTKVDAPEMRALLALYGEWDPILYADLHVTDGSKLQHDVAVIIHPRLAPPEELRTESQALSRRVQRDLTARGHLPLPFYPELRTHDEPSSGFVDGIPPPRFSNAYAWWRNRIGVLVETHSWKDYARRVTTTIDVLDVLMAATAERGEKWLAAARLADEQGARMGGAEVVLDWEAGEGKASTVEIRGYVWEKVPSEAAGRPVVRYDESKPQVWRVPFWDEARPAATVRAPRGGYVIPRAWAPLVLERLRAHGVVTRPLSAAKHGVAVERYRARVASFDPRSVEGHQRLTVEGAWEPAVHELQAGSVFVPIAQPLARLVVQLLEPTAPDSFAAWGFFNAAFERREYMEDYVAAEVAEAMLRDPAVRAAFEKRLAEDPAFAKDAAARLDFFYERHPAYDTEYRVYPVMRVEAAP